MPSTSASTVSAVLLELAQRLLTAESEEVRKVLQTQFTSSLLDESSNLCRRVTDLATDARQYREELERAKTALKKIQGFRERNDLSNTDPRQRKVYVEELTALVEEYAAKLEQLVKAIYNAVKESKGWPGFWKIGVFTLSCIGSAIAVICSPSVPSIVLTIGTGIATAATVYSSYATGSTIEELLKDAEEFNRTVHNVKLELRLESIQLGRL